MFSARCAKRAPPELDAAGIELAVGLEQGWYLMSVRDLEIELARHRDPTLVTEPSNAQALTVEEALAYRGAGNVPDAKGRTLRLVLWVDDEPLSVKRLRYEPDFHSAPTWRREGGRPINVVPLAAGTPSAPADEVPWWEQPDVAPLEAEWQQTGAIEGIAIPAELRGFVLKTIASLRSAGMEITSRSIVDSVSRWLSPQQVKELAEALEGPDRE